MSTILLFFSLLVNFATTFVSISGTGMSVPAIFGLDILSEYISSTNCLSVKASSSLTSYDKKEEKCWLTINLLLQSLALLLLL